MERPLNHSQFGSDTPNEPVRRESFFSELLRFALIALLIVLPVRLFVAQPFIVSGASMEETFATGQYLIVDQLTYHFEEPKRGDIVIFRYPNDPSKYFIKRVIGLPGDTVTITDGNVTITNDSETFQSPLSEPYVASANRSNGSLERTLGDGEYFVMGDNRGASSDSRAWGTLPRENIVGRAFVRLFPFNELDFLPGAYNLDREIIE